MKEQLIKLLPTRIYLELKWLDYKLRRKDDFSATQLLRKKETESEGSYKPFDDKKAIFVHIPKCAGISVNKALFGNLAGGHTTLEQYLTVYEPKAIQNYFKFTIVRNPWDRVVSAYFFLQQGGMNKWDKEFYEKELAQYESFDDFVKNWLSNPKNLYKHHHFKPQTHYILDKYNKVKIDFIGYLERIDEDFKFLCDKLNVDAELPVNNRSKRKDYCAYYNEETQAVVAKMYQKDIEYLGYDFK
ncbi:sulfotransferase family 2 domain-containing protein [Alteromonas sp. 5E99-2]|uniref:sulfotransferase family 2 domain-containing protein n=1 Tax=Alteromonas sp. 5E99-2 TaxID=2817683 RepID=UPI001A987B90|nr:sulfotransferase family 2 domain-containing protein [Alteromonas sp. 5E99-2]MBO1256853.1 sulfotransferase family 2 domain-containing protein [Alteromonas sp. 5E99-2]